MAYGDTLGWVQVQQPRTLASEDPFDGPLDYPLDDPLEDPLDETLDEPFGVVHNNMRGKQKDPYQSILQDRELVHYAS